MTDSHRSDPLHQAGPTARPSRPGTGVVIVLLAVIITVVLLAATSGRQALSTLLEIRPFGSDRPAWPSGGQSALLLPDRTPSSHGRADAVPIASVTKIMTALIVLEHDPITPDQDGFRLTIRPADVRATERSRERDESLVDVQAGEVINERQALLALLLPSANNMARLLAVRVAGSEADFVGLMNGRARSLGLSETHYADASGFDARSVSTARDQVVLARLAMHNATFAWLVRQPDADIPVAGTVHNTDDLLGRHGFVGIKTGSDQAAGGCFVFAATKSVDGRPQLIIGAVLGQRGPDLVEAALKAARQLAASTPG